MRRQSIRQLLDAEPDRAFIESGLIGAIIVVVVIVALAQIGFSLVPMFG